MHDRSKQVLSSLLYNCPNLLSIYKINDLNISAHQYPVHNNIMQHFTQPSILIAIGLTTSTYIFQRYTKHKVHVIEINTEVTYYKTGIGKLKNKIIKQLKQKDYIPAPITKKIILPHTYTKKQATGDIYTEQSPDHYQLQNNPNTPTQPPEPIIQKHINNQPII